MNAENDGTTEDASDPAQVDAVVMPEWGQLVFIDYKYKRLTERFVRQWERIPCKECGIFLGFRTISNGYHDEGYQPKNYFKVALISPGLTKNPIYVPLDAIRA